MPCGSHLDEEHQLTTSLAGLMSRLVSFILGEYSGQVATADAAVDAHHPAQPTGSWARSVRGPDGEDSASPSCVDAGAAACDRDGLRAVLDTSTRRNMQLYSRLGFETTAELQPDGGAPRVW